MSTNKVVNLGEMMRQARPKKKPEVEGLDDDYVKKAFGLLDDAIEETKHRSINYQIWRKEQIADFEIKAEYMSEEELEEEKKALFEFQKENIFDILDGKYNTVKASDVPNNITNKKENDKQENSSSNTEEYTEPTTTFIYEED